MSLIIELKVPDIGNVSDVEIAEVLIQPGDVVELEQTLLIMETDKATMDLPAPAAGTVEDVKVKVGDLVSEGSLVATLSASTEEKAAASPSEELAKTQAEPENKEPDEPKPEKQPSAPPIVQASRQGKAHATPAVRRFARELGVDISKIQAGSG